jgi:hypothetical protein
LAGENGKKFSRFWLHHVANPPNSVAKTVGRLWSELAGCGVTSGRRFGLAQFSNGLQFFDDFSELICDLGLFIVESFSGFKVLSFDIFWDLGRWLIHCRAV